MKLRLTALIFAVMMLFSGCEFLEAIKGASPSAEDAVDLGNIDDSFVERNGVGYAWSKLDDGEKANLAAIVNSLKNYEEHCELPVSIPGDEIWDFVNFAYDCAAEYVYINRLGKTTAYKEESGDVVAIDIPFDKNLAKNPGEAEGVIRVLEERIDEIIAGMPKRSDWDKIKYLHDYIVLNCTYDLESKNCNTAYGALIDGKAACQGYADALQLLLARAGFEICNVMDNGNSEGTRHCWNLVKLSDGGWYNIDCTWDDPIGRDPDFINYEYFLISDADILIDHEPPKPCRYYDYPAADSDEMSYYSVTSNFCTTYEEVYAAVERQVNECVEKEQRYVYIRMSDEELYNDVCKRFFSADAMHDGSKRLYNILEGIVQRTGARIDPNTWYYSMGYADGKGRFTTIITIAYRAVIAPMGN